MYRFLIIALVVLVSAAGPVRAQDPQFSQYYSAPLYLNPGFTGITQEHRVTFNHRLQWPNLPQAFATYSASYDVFVDELRSGFGIMASTDKMGSAGWRTSYVGLLYSYKVRLSENWVFSPGLYFAYGSNGLDRSKLLLRDGLEYDGQSIDPEVNRLGNQNYFDFSAGMVLYNRSLWLGVSSYHMNEPNMSVLGNESRLPMKVNIHGGMKLPLYSGPRKLARVSYITPSFVYKFQGSQFQQLDVGLQYHIDPIAVGVWYRGIPIQDDVDNEGETLQMVQKDALVLVMSFMLKNLQIGYSYDFTVSRLETTTGGSHEISLVYEFSNDKRKKKKAMKLIPCPSFNSKEGFWN
ncbi:type IX secretion system membrane protein PorP/SprF [Fulvivirga maritima]|uniref:PorP/SprF family type IX secretion system membrane protein n=1 Tax=Fulvivirga maritima TaxID=2904247 RepID=UPI001F304309|nr:type IX secretion system membrane protein PorP/SprF [Fulvivirga maritima]UII26445.1 type IX secretion system membrane protein PorP/SprF [Fulvivirga maritima]